MKSLFIILSIFLVGCVAATTTPAAFIQPSTSLISLEPINGLSGDFVTANLELTNVTNGVAGYIITVSSDDAGVANISNVSYPAFGLTLTRTDLPWQEVIMSAADLTKLIDGVQPKATLAAIQFQLIGNGVANVTITIQSLDDDSGFPIDVLPIKSKITVNRKQSNILINLSDGVRNQLEKWVEEFTAEPPQNVSDQAQLDLYGIILALDGKGVFNSKVITSQMNDVILEITQSYFSAVRYRYKSKNGVTESNVSRAEMRNFFNTLIAYSGNEAVKTKKPFPELSNKSGSGKGNTQYWLPNATRFITFWSELAGDGDGDLFDELDEGFGAGRGSGSGPDDAVTAWQSDVNPFNWGIGTNLDNLDDCLCNTGHIFRSRSRKDKSGGRQLDVLIRLAEDNTTITQQWYVDIDNVWTTRVRTLTAIQADSIGTYDDLNILIFGLTVGGGAPRRAQESAHELETPDGVTGLSSFGTIY